MQYSGEFELLNYSEFGSVVNDVLYGVDTSALPAPVSNASSAAPAVVAQGSTARATVSAQSPPSSPVILPPGAVLAGGQFASGRATADASPALELRSLAPQQSPLEPPLMPCKRSLVSVRSAFVTRDSFDPSEQHEYPRTVRVYSMYIRIITTTTS